MPTKKEPPRAWQRMLSGRRLDLLNPSPLDVEIEDIAHGLARVARWNGQTKGAHAYSVAQHCVFVEKIAVELKPRLSREARLMALLHDAPEYVIGDLISPFKAAVGIDYKAFENRLLAAIRSADTGGLLRDAMLFDVYKPQQASAALALDEKSLAVRLTLARSDATLTDDQIEAAVRAVVERIASQLGGRLRG